MPYADPEKAKEWRKNYRKKNIVQIKKNMKKYYEKNKKKLKKISREYGKKHKEDSRPKKRIYRKEKRRKDKLEIYRLEGNVCLCCGIDDPIYFNIDHVDNDGHLERKKQNSGKITGNILTLAKYLKNPKRYQILCANCNWAKHKNGGELYNPKKRRKVS